MAMTCRPTARSSRAQRRDRHGRWHTVDTDLGLDFVWRVDDQGHYSAIWEVPLTVPAGTYRFRVTAQRYALELGAVPGAAGDDAAARCSAAARCA